MVFWTPSFPTSLQTYPLQCKKPSHLKPCCHCCQDRLLAATDRPLSNCWGHHLSKIVKVCGHFLLADSVSLMQYLRLYLRLYTVHACDIRIYVYTYTYISLANNKIFYTSIHYCFPWTSVFIGCVSPELLDLQGPGGPFPKGLCKSQEFKVG